MKYLIIVLCLILVGCNEPNNQPEVVYKSPIKTKMIRFYCSENLDLKTATMIALSTWNKTLDNRFTCLEADDKDHANLVVRFDKLSFTTLGMCNGSEIIINSNFKFHHGVPRGVNGLDVDLDGLLIHEVGHFFGMHHVVGGAMNSRLLNREPVLIPEEIKIIRGIYDQNH